jgi:hypothetical protein
MKHLPLFLIVLGTAGPLVKGEVEEDIPLGIEAVTGLRSAYSYRSFELAATTLDFQLETEVAINNDLSLAAGGWIASESGGDFEEKTSFLEVRTTIGDAFTTSAAVAYHAYNNSVIRSGFDLSGTFTWHAEATWNLSTSVAHDCGAGGWHAELSSHWYKRLSDDAFLSGKIGISGTEDYYELSGLSDINGRLSLTYNVNTMLSVTPFVGWSYELRHRDGDEIHAGIWFEVSF